MNRRSPLPEPQRAAFSALLRRARLARGLTYQAAAEAVGDYLDDMESPSWRWVQDLEGCPPRPMANTVWLDALLTIYGLGWSQVLEALGIGETTIPRVAVRDWSYL